MKILFVSPTGSFFSGAEVAIVNLMDYLSQEGHDIYNVIPDNGTNADQTYLDRMQKSKITLYQIPALQWWWADKQPLASYEKNAIITSQHGAIAKLRTIIREEKIDLVISNTINTFQGAFAAACERIPHHYIIHEFPEGEFAYYKEKIQLLDALSQKIFVVDGQLFTELTAYFPKEKLVPFIPYTNPGQHQLKQGNSIKLISIGGINERKNQLELLQAYHKLAQPNMELLFIGGWDTAYKKQCDDYISENALTNVSFLGHLTDPWSVVTDKDIIIFTSKQEAFPLVYAEAVLNGVPAIISDNGGHLTVQQFFGVGEAYPLGNIDQLTKMINHFITNFSELASLYQSNKKIAHKRYTLENSVKPFLPFLKKSSTTDFAQILSQAKTFFDLDLGQELESHLFWQHLTIFLSDERGYYVPERSITAPLKQQDSFELVITTEQTIRIDLSEFPSAFENVQLIIKNTDEKIEPVLIRARRENEMILCYDNDPQLIYDVSAHQGQTLIFSYHQLTEPLLTQTMQHLIEDKETSYQQLMNDYQQLHQNYHKVIGSRRWIIPTRIINKLRQLKRTFKSLF